MFLGKILFIEDSNSICNVYAHILREAGYYLEYATNGQEALKLLENDSFEVVICDFYLPDTNGIQLINTIKRKDKTVYSILFTSSSSDETETEALNNGIDDFILKPCPKDRLLIGIKRGLEIRQEHIYRELIGQKILELSQLTKKYTGYVTA